MGLLVGRALLWTGRGIARLVRRVFVGLLVVGMLAVPWAVAGPARAAQQPAQLHQLLGALGLGPPLSEEPAAFTLPKLRGQRQVRLQDYQGQVVLLYFWATW